MTTIRPRQYEWVVRNEGRPGEYYVLRLEGLSVTVHTMVECPKDMWFLSVTEWWGPIALTSKEPEKAREEALNLVLHRLKKLTLQVEQATKSVSHHVGAKTQG